MKKNAFYAQSGGVTSVINATASALILESKKYKSKIGKVYAGKNGILGALNEELIDTSKESISAIKSLKSRPGGVFGSCRVKLKSLEENLKIRKKIASFTVPLGAPINMDGTAIMQGVATVFIANLYGIDLMFNDFVSI